MEKWDTAVDSQAKAFLVGAREAAPLMSDGGRIVAITFAPGGRFGSWQPWVAMGAAKAAMEVLVRYFAVALANRGITVNTISPGWVEDSVLNSLPEVFQTGLREWQERGWTPMGRLGTPADIGNAVALICSPEAGWITGQLIDVDGGASLVDAHLPLGVPGGTRTLGANRLTVTALRDRPFHWGRPAQRSRVAVCRALAPAGVRGGSRRPFGWVKRLSGSGGQSGNSTLTA